MPATARRLAGLAVAALVLAPPAAALPDDPESWLEVRSAHFTLYSDAAAERAAEIAVGLERLREAFARLAPEMALRSPVPTRIVAFRDDASYAPYKTVADRGSLKILGQFLAHRDGNFITLDADPRRLGSLATVQHEFVHELVQHNLPGVPLWFNEGLAEYYSTFAVEGGYAFLGRPVERHLRWLRGHPEFSLAAVLAATRESAANHGAEEAGRLYAVSWLLVHYLLSGDEARLAGAAELLLRLDRGEPPEAALEAALGYGVGPLRERLRGYLLSELPQGGLRVELPARAEPVAAPAAPAEVLVVLGDLQLRQRRTAEAERHYHLALAWDGYHPEAHSGLAAVRDLEGRLEEAAVMHEEAMALGPRSAESWLRHGRHLVARYQAGAGRPEELAEAARRALAEAARLDPRFAECRALLGASQLLAGGDVEHGVELLEAVRRELPRRADVLYNLVQLYLAAERIPPAAALVRGALAAAGDDELLARAREAVERASLLDAARAAVADGELEEGLRLLDLAFEAANDPEVKASLAARRTALRRQLRAR